MKRIAAIILFSLIGLATTARTLPKMPERHVNFIVLSDTGEKDSTRRVAARHMASIMDEAVERCNIDFIIHSGDQIHDNGVKSGTDPEWDFKLMDVFSGERLQSVAWHAVPGNHEYRGNPDAVADLSNVHEWWQTPSRYYARSERINTKGDELLVVYTDTTPLVRKYRKRWSEGRYGDSYGADEIAWADSVLSNSDAKWKIVIGHHPLYAHTDKNSEEKTDMQNALLPVLEHGGADMYINGHIHDFQHLKPEGSRISYVTNASGVRTRTPEAVDGTVFCSAGPGFMVCSVSGSRIKFRFVDNRGNVIYTYSIRK